MEEPFATDDADLHGSSESCLETFLPSSAPSAWIRVYPWQKNHVTRNGTSAARTIRARCRSVEDFGVGVGVRIGHGRAFLPRMTRIYADQAKAGWRGRPHLLLHPRGSALIRGGKHVTQNGRSAARTIRERCRGVESFGVGVGVCIGHGRAIFATDDTDARGFERVERKLVGEAGFIFCSIRADPH